MHSSHYGGPTDVFSGAMGAAVTRKVKCIRIIATAAFTSLSFQFPASTAGAAGPETIAAYPALFELYDVASFRLASGSIQVIYDY